MTDLVYSETFIGDCSRGCCRPATVRVHNDFKLCALHHLEFEITEEVNGAGLGIDVLKQTISEAEFHGADGLVEHLQQLLAYEEERLALARRRQAQLDQVEEERDGGVTRERMAGRARSAVG